jgi:hypothetical protein
MTLAEEKALLDRFAKAARAGRDIEHPEFENGV